MNSCGFVTVLIVSILVIGAGIITAVFFLLDVDEDIQDLLNDPSPTRMPSAAPTLDLNICNGVPGLCDLSVSDALFAMVHNSNANEASGNQLPYHAGSINDALAAGYRGLSLDVSLCDGKVVLYHMHCALGNEPIRPVFEGIRDFLLENPREVLLINLQVDSSFNDVPALLNSIAGQIDLADGFSSLLYQHEEEESATTSSTAWPTFRELLSKNKRVILFYWNVPRVSSNLPVGFHYLYDYTAETASGLETMDEARTPSIACVVDNNESADSGSIEFLAIHLYLESSTPPLVSDSAVLNEESFVRNQIEACSVFNGMDVNIVSVNWWGVGDVVQVVQEINQERSLLVS